MKNVSAVISYWSVKNTRKEQMKSQNAIAFKQQLDKVITLIKRALNIDAHFSVAIYPYFDEIFQLGLKTFQLIEKDEYDWNAIYEHAADELKEKEISEEDEILINNALFGIRTLKKVAQKVTSNNTRPFTDLVPVSVNIDNISYESFLQFLRTEDGENAMNFFHSSLMLDAALIATDILLDDIHKKINEQKHIELNEVIVKNAQLYGAAARGLGIFGGRKKKSPRTEEASETSEDLELAELGMKNYLNLIN